VEFDAAQVAPNITGTLTSKGGVRESPRPYLFVTEAKGPGGVRWWPMTFTLVRRRRSCKTPAGRWRHCTSGRRTAAVQLRK
jgi:hypothetical protein